MIVYYRRTVIVPVIVNYHSFLMVNYHSFVIVNYHSSVIVDYHSYLTITVIIYVIVLLQSSLSKKSLNLFCQSIIYQGETNTIVVEYIVSHFMLFLPPSQQPPGRKCVISAFFVENPMWLRIQNLSKKMKRCGTSQKYDNTQTKLKPLSSENKCDVDNSKVLLLKMFEWIWNEQYTYVNTKQWFQRNFYSILRCRQALPDAS